MAERVGFEPTEPVKAHSISNAANSTTLAPFRAGINDTKKPGDRLNGKRREIVPLFTIPAFAITIQ